DFRATMDLVEAVGYGYAYSFKYSTRPGTPAAERAQLPEDVKSERLQRLQALITRQQRAVQDAMVGREVSVLIERQGRLKGQMVGKSEFLHAVHIRDADLKVGDLVRVQIVDSGSNSLAGELVCAPA
ncbi:MAG: TRAM domain-containing protein, partial [Pseudomonadota bacterium]